MSAALSFFLFLLFIAATHCIPFPLIRQASPSPQGSDVPIPDPGDGPGGGPPEISPSPTPTISPSVSPSVAPSLSPLPSPLETSIEATAEESPSVGDNAAPPNGNGGTEISGRGARMANGLSGGLIAGLFVFILLVAFVVIGAAARGNGARQQQSVYTAAAVKPPDETDGTRLVPPTKPDPAHLDKDVARDKGPAEQVASEEEPSDRGGDGGAMMGMGALGGAGAIERGATPPPHDYVLGAGPTTSRTDFMDLTSKFEREEIGDHSAVLGMERAERVAHEGVGEAAAVAVVTESKTEGESLPDRGQAGVPVTFDSQERLMAGGDGSGAVSDAAMSLTATSIAEESGDMPSLERDPPMGVRRDGGDVF